MSNQDNTLLLTPGSEWSNKDGTRTVHVLHLTNQGVSADALAKHPQQVVYLTQNKVVLSRATDSFLKLFSYSGVNLALEVALTAVITNLGLPEPELTIDEVEQDDLDSDTEDQDEDTGAASIDLSTIFGDGTVDNGTGTDSDVENDNTGSISLDFLGSDDSDAPAIPSGVRNLIDEEPDYDDDTAVIAASVEPHVTFQADSEKPTATSLVALQFALHSYSQEPLTHQDGSRVLHRLVFDTSRVTAEEVYSAFHLDSAYAAVLPVVAGHTIEWDQFKGVWPLFQEGRTYSVVFLETFAEEAVTGDDVTLTVEAESDTDDAAVLAALDQVEEVTDVEADDLDAPVVEATAVEAPQATPAPAAVAAPATLKVG